MHKDQNDSQYGTLTPDDDKEEKKDDKKKKAAIVGLAALAVLGASAVCVGTGTIDKFFPEEEEIVVKVIPTQRTYPTEQEQVDVREGWYGSFEGIARGART